MDETILRSSALNMAAMRAPQNASVDELLAEADKIVAWLKGGESGNEASAPAQHESQAAVAGQGPKGE